MTKQGKLGITKYAANALGDIVHVDLPADGDSFSTGESIVSIINFHGHENYFEIRFLNLHLYILMYFQCAIESVKTAADVYMPCDGKILKVNERLEDEPQHISIAAEEDGWLMEMEIDDVD